ncbi:MULTISPECIES: hypothetical protein [Burkholderia]|uniref:hypothetical protein n=1 Tax=Burkholderia TaxID=32008 RepID=UPI0012E3ECCC|nr:MULTISPECIES: hypothetical protein [Burkholderia]
MLQSSAFLAVLAAYSRAAIHEIPPTLPIREGMHAHRDNAMRAGSMTQPHHAERVKKSYSCSRDPMFENLSVPRSKLALSCAVAVFFYEIETMEKLRAAKLACAINAAGRFTEA